MSVDPAVASAIATLFTAFTSFFTYLQARSTRATAEQSRKNLEASIILELARRQNEVNETRNKLLAMTIDWKSFNQRYTTDESKLVSSEWKVIREVGSLYEFAGVMVRRGFIDAQIVFDIINVQPLLWERLEETFKNMRKSYNPELWENWQYLVEERRKSASR